MSTVGACCSGSALATLPALWAAGAMPCLSNGSSFCVQGSAPTFACGYASPSIGQSHSSLHYPSAMDSLSRSAPTCAKSWDVSGAPTLATALIAAGLLTAAPANAFETTEPRGMWNRDTHGVYNHGNVDPLMFFGLATAGIVIALALYAITNRNGEGKNKAKTKTKGPLEANGPKTSVGGSGERSSVSSPNGLSPAEIAAIELVEWLSTEEDDEPQTGVSNNSNGNGNGQGASPRAKAGVRIGDVSPSVFPPPLPVPPAPTSSSGLGVGIGADFYHEPGQEE